MTIEQLVEEMEEHEDTVECVLCQDLFDKSTCRKELNLGWLCHRCADDLTARGEGPVFREDNYWDFLDDSTEPEELHDLGNEYDGGYPLDTPELPEADEPLTFEEEYLEESDNPKESNEPILGTIGYFVYDKQDKQVAGPFDKIYDATAWANKHNQPTIKVHNYYYYPDDEEELIKLEPQILKSDI
jgi:hypothetical protein